MWPLLLVLSACTKSDPNILRTPLDQVPQTEQWAVDGLDAPVLVVYTDHHVPHIYAWNERDLRRVQGFVVARDRWFQLDLVRRLSTGRLTELMGDAMLETDLESRGISMAHATDSLLLNLTPEQRDAYNAYAEGFNDYRRAVEDGLLPPPSEYELIAPLLGKQPAEMLTEFTLRDVAAIGGTILFRLGYETGDVGRTEDYLRLEGLFAGRDHEDLRSAGAWEIWGDHSPVFPLSSANQLKGGTRSKPFPQFRPPPRVNRDMLRRLDARMDRVQDRFGRDHENGWGSNAWAVAGTYTADGHALLAGDGHLELDIPSLLTHIGLDTAHLGGGTVEQNGMVLIGMPELSVGTNGHVAWSTTQHSGDITDWYAEEVQLDENGKPAATRFRGEWKPVIEVKETYDIAQVDVLGSEARVETWSRFETFDGRWITDIEGVEVASDATTAKGETLLNLTGAWVIPGDADGDGVVTGVSFDFTGLDGGNLFAQWAEQGKAKNVGDIFASTRMANALSQNLLAADSSGDVFFSGYEMVPCRGYLPRGKDGVWKPGADPTMLLDGTRYGGFTVPIEPDFTADESSEDPYRCVVPHSQYPHRFTPPEGYLVTANHDPGGGTLDGTMWNDPWYIGGPWTEGYRADTITRGLEGAIADGGASLTDMQDIQGAHESGIARRHLDDILAVLEDAQNGDVDGPSLAIYQANASRFDEVHSRLSAWQRAKQPALSGVQTFYHPRVTADERDHAVATTIFNVWFSDLLRETFDDEGLPGDVWVSGGSAGRLRVIDRMFRGAGPNNRLNSPAWNPATREWVWWDDLRTQGVTESSDEIVLRSLRIALDFLESAETAPGEGGFGTPDMDAWIWGLRHQVEFGSLVGAYTDDDLLDSIFGRFAIDSSRLPLAENIGSDDARRGLQWFPRPGDNRAVDAANNGFSGRSFRHGSGPVMRMVFSMSPDGVRGRNVLPGGQSGVLDSPYYDDQIELWLANETFDMAMTVPEVVEAGVERHTFLPDPAF